MENKVNKYLSVSYQLYSIDENGGKHLEEQTQQGQPFQFISGFGFSLDSFEQQIVALEQGAKFDFTLTPAQAFGEYDPEGVHKMKREVFSINGHFDHENIYPGAVITLMDADERRFMARVDPLAGQTLQFTGLVLENREATKEEIQHMLNHMSGEGCGCGCEDCDDGCGHHHHDHEGGCGCGHCH